MNLREIFRTSLRSLRINPMRAMLSILGIIFGIASVIVLIAMGEGVKADISNQVESLGTNLIVVRSGAPDDSSDAAATQALQMQTASLGESTLTLTDLESVEALIEEGLLSNVYPLITSFTSMEMTTGEESKSLRVSMNGTNLSCPKIAEDKIEFGRVFDQDEEGVCIVGETVARRLANSENPEDAMNRIANLGAGVTREVEIVGILNKQEKTPVANPNLDVYVTLSDAQELLGDTERMKIQEINSEAVDKDSIEEAKEAISQAILDNHDGEENFNISTAEDLMSTYQQIFDILTALVIGVAIISLIEGGIGVANIMYVSVKERTKEIGVRLAQGASKKMVILQFLFESILLCIIGAIIGIPLGVLTAIGISNLTVLPAMPTMWSVGVAFGAALITGILAGVYPARQATKVEITEALRSEV